MFAWFIKKFVRVSISERIAEQLNEARLDLLNAEHQFENWQSAITVYKARVKRLEKTTMEQVGNDGHNKV